MAIRARFFAACESDAENPRLDAVMPPQTSLLIRLEAARTGSALIALVSGGDEGEKIWIGVGGGGALVLVSIVKIAMFLYLRKTETGK